MQADTSSLVREEDRLVIVKLVKQLLSEKPSDPIPFMYSYLKQVNQGIDPPITPANHEVAEMKNLRKKYEYLKSQVGGADSASETPESDEDSEEEEKQAPVKSKVVK